MWRGKQARPPFYSAITGVLRLDFALSHRRFQKPLKPLNLPEAPCRVKRTACRGWGLVSNNTGPFFTTQARQQP